MDQESLKTLQRLICEAAEPATLAVLARTSKSFFLPAVRELYRDCGWEAFLHHMTLFGERVGGVISVDLMANRRRSMPVIFAAQRFDLYSALVHSLAFRGVIDRPRTPIPSADVPVRRDAHGIPIIIGHTRLNVFYFIGESQEIMSRIGSGTMVWLRVIASMSRWEYMFPCLENFSLILDRKTPCGALFPLFAPKRDGLRRFTIYVLADAQAQHVALLLRLLQGKVPGLEELHLLGWTRQLADAIPVIKDVLLSLPALRIVTAGPACMDREVIQILGSYPGLRQLILDGHGDPDSFERCDAILAARPTDNGEAGYFYDLRKLVFSWIPLATAARFLMEIDADYLDELVIRSHPQHEIFDDDVNQLFPAICYQTSVKALTVEILDAGFHGQPLGIWAYLENIGAALDLRSLDMKLSGEFGPTDEMIDELAQALPNLRALTFMWEEPQVAPDDMDIDDESSVLGPTSRSLVSLRKHCAELQYLQLQAMRIKAQDLQVSLDGIRPAPLCLKLMEETVDDMDETAIFLLKVAAPLWVGRLRSLDDEAEEETDPIWAKIIMKMAVLRRFLASGAHGFNSSVAMVEDRYLGED